MTDKRRIVDPACHEFTVNLNYTSHGLNPWFAADSVVKDHDGGTVLEFVDLPSLDERADVSIRFQDGNLLPPKDGETPAGTEIDMETITLEPGGLTSPHTDGVSVRAAGSNVAAGVLDAGEP